MSRCVVCDEPLGLGTEAVERRCTEHRQSFSDSLPLRSVDAVADRDHQRTTEKLRTAVEVARAFAGSSSTDSFETDVHVDRHGDVKISVRRGTATASSSADDLPNDPDDESGAWEER